jgi:hypothetical protein
MGLDGPGATGCRFLIELLHAVLESEMTHGTGPGDGTGRAGRSGRALGRLARRHVGMNEQATRVMTAMDRTR